MDVPVQFFQSVIALELATIGALLYQVRYFEVGDQVDGSTRVRDPWRRVLMAIVLGVTLFGSLIAMATGGQSIAAIVVTLGLAISIIPILLRVLPPLSRDHATDRRQPEASATVVGLALYFVAVAVVVVILNT